jgi:hypothetical protein
VVGKLYQLGRRLLYCILCNLRIFILFGRFSKLVVLICPQAVQALYKVLELSEGKRTDLITLTKIVEEVERLKSAATPTDSTDLDLLKDNDASTVDEVKIADLDIKQNEAHPPKPDETAEQIRATREALTLFEMTGKLLNQVIF